MTEEFLFECYDNNIYLLFLPAHASHVLQPLDVAVFGPLKHAYRKFISDLASIADSSQIGKISFLYNYNKARKKALTKNNACAGFKATGLWPVNLAKVLMNPMVTQTPIPPVTPISPAKEKSYSLFQTPRSSYQVRKVLESIPAGAVKDPAVRILFRKIGITLDRQGMELEAQNREISLLKHQNEKLLPKRKRKVTFNGNTEFAKVPAVKKARKEMLKITQPVRTSNRVRKLKLEDLCHQFHLNIH